MLNLTVWNKHLTQAGYKIFLLVFILLILTFIFMAVDLSFSKMLCGLICVVLSGFLFFKSYKKNIAACNEEINELVLKNNIFEAIINTSYRAFLITDGNNILYHNNAVLHLFKKSARYIETCQLSDLFYDDDWVKINQYLQAKKEVEKLVVRTTRFSDFEYDFRYCQIALRKYFYRGKEQYIVSLTDVTEYFVDNDTKSQTISLFQEAFNQLPQAVSLFDTKGQLVFMNRAAKDIWAETNFIDLIEFNINKNLLRTGFEIATTGDIYSDTRVIARKYSNSDEENEEWGNILLAPIQTQDGTNFIEFVVDNITSLKQEISELENKLQTFSIEYDKTLVATLLWDSNGSFLQANQMFYNMFNILPGSIVDLQITLTQEKIQELITFKEIAIVNDKVGSSKKYIISGVSKLFDKIYSMIDSEAYVCIDSKSEIFRYAKLKPYNNTQTTMLTQSITEGKDIWLWINTHALIDQEGKFYATAINLLNISEYIDIQKKHQTNLTYIKAIANNFYAGIIFIVNSDNQIVFWGGEEKIKNKIVLDNDSWMTGVVNLNTVPEIAKYKNNIQSSLSGSYSKLTVSIFEDSYDFQFFPIRNDEGDVEFCMGIGANVTDRVTFEQQLLVQKLFLDKIFAESQIPQVIVDASGKIDTVNIQYCQMAGSTAEKLIWTSIYDKGSWLNKEIVIKNFEKTLTGQYTQFEITEQKTFSILGDIAAEEYLYVLSCKSYPILDNNIVTHVIFNFIDVSDTRMLIESMRKSNSINSIVTSNYPEGILIIIDKHKKFVLFEGHEELELLGLQGAAILGKYLNEVDSSMVSIIKPQIEKIFVLEKKADQKINFDFSIEIIQENKFPMTYFYEANIIPIWDFNNEIESVFICINNITNRKQLEKTILEFNLTLEQEVIQRTTELENTTKSLERYVSELQKTQDELLRAQKELSENLNKEQELNHMKSRFISLMSHEFRTPLTIIQTTLYLLDTFYEMQLKDKFDSGVNTILNTINMMTKLLDNILFLDNAKEYEVSFVEIDVVACIKESINEIAATCKAGQKINFNTNNTSVIMLTDIRLLRQIVCNIFSNAVQYSPKTSEINVNINDTEKELSITIQDFGNGISDDVIDRIFDTFVRSQDFTNISGTGLGLSITKSCVNLLKGDITFETKKSEGTTFFITLPKLDMKSMLQM